MAGMERIKAGPSKNVFINNDDNTFTINNETGEGTIFSHEIMNGIYLLKCNFQMTDISIEMHHNSDLFCLDYCYEGRLEWQRPGGSCLYQREGDLTMDSRRFSVNRYHLPLGHYRALTLAFFLPQAKQSIQDVLRNCPVDIAEIKRRFTPNAIPFLVRDNITITNILKTIDNTTGANWKTRIALEILELLTYLNSVEVGQIEVVNEYFYKSHVDKVKKMHEMMVANLERHYTLEDLSRRYHIPVTPLTKCFKGVYGKPVYSYMREYRIKQAAERLLKDEVSIAEAGLSVGYANPSKFSSAFRQVLGILPKHYRKTQAVRDK